MSFLSPTPRTAPELIRRTTLAALLIGLVGCERPPETVVIYASVDQRFATEILSRFERQTGIRVAATYDTEAGKTTGFVRKLQRETERPRCDVWWSSEVFGTIELARQGLLEPYESPAAKDVPVGWKDARHHWTGLAARARVLAFHTERLSAAQLPQTWPELSEPQWAGRLALANPQFGTTRGHVAAMFAYWGPDAARTFLQSLRDAGTRVADGNAHAVRLVAGGEADLCATDTDDVWVAQRRGQPIGLIYPRLEPDGPIVWIPCSVALVRGGPNPAAARRLIDFLVSAEVERALAESDSRNVPVRSDLRTELGLGEPEPAPLDFDRVADALPGAMQVARDTLLR